MRDGLIRATTVDEDTVRQPDGIDLERFFTDKDTAQLDELLGVVRDGNTAEDLGTFTAVATAV
ncbi:hypothetical protein [Nocardia sp. NPDC005366]|uniref:hypothetical protein n=1 Tax=Nocardia sp. NPDC005366 TaxID=3156878 RepID=UPI0033A0DA3E